MPTATQTSVLSKISSLMEEINGAEKRATELDLSGSAKKDPGGHQGPSTHPSARVASNLEKTPLGARAKENETDMKHDHPTGVDNSTGSGGSQDDKQFHIGMHPSATGEDPKNEDNYRHGGKDDKRQGNRGGTEGPFNAEDIGEKYSSMKFEEIVKLAYAKMNNCIADIANGKQLNIPSSQITPELAKQAGQALADMAVKPTEPQMSKQAVAQLIVEQTILDARTNADLVGEFLTKYAAELDRLAQEKLAAGPVDPMGGAMEGAGPEAGAGGPPMPPPGAGPEAGPLGGGGGEGGGEGGLDDLINALLEMGLTPEQIMQALQEHEGGGAGGPPGMGGPPPGAGPEMGGAPPMGEPKAASYQLREERQVLYKLAHAANDLFRSGQFRLKPVNNGTKEALARNELQRYVLEVCGVR